MESAQGLIKGSSTWSGERFGICIWGQWFEKNVISCLRLRLYNQLVIFGIVYFSWLPPVMCPQVTPSTLGEPPHQCLLQWLWPGKAGAPPGDTSCPITMCSEMLGALARQGTQEELQQKDTWLSTMRKSTSFAFF